MESPKYQMIPGILGISFIGNCCIIKLSVKNGKCIDNIGSEEV